MLVKSGHPVSLCSTASLLSMLVYVHYMPAKCHPVPRKHGRQEGDLHASLCPAGAPALSFVSSNQNLLGLSIHQQEFCRSPLACCCVLLACSCCQLCHVGPLDPVAAWRRAATGYSYQPHAEALWLPAGLHMSTRSMGNHVGRLPSR